MSDQNATVAVVMGSSSDWPTVKRTVAVLDELGGRGLIDWSRVVLGGASVRAKRAAA